MSKPTAADIGRACLSCGATQTPVWRTGPVGPRTMCNRCGIKWMRGNPSERGKKRSSGSNTFFAKGDASETSEASSSSSPEINPIKHSNSGSSSSKKKKIKASFDDYVPQVREEEDIDPDTEFIVKTKSPLKKRKKVIVVKEDSSSPSEKESKSVAGKEVPSFEFDDSYLLDLSYNSDEDRRGQAESPIKHEIQSHIPIPYPYEAASSNRLIASMNENEAHFKEKTAIEITSMLNQRMHSITVPSTGFDFRRGQQLEYRIGCHLPATLQYLDLSFRSNVNASVLQALPCVLQYLNLSNCKQLSDSDLLYLPPQLQTLVLTNCTLITDESLKHLPHSLQSLNISNCYNITDEGLKSLPVTLTSLNISMCFKVTDEGMVGLPPLLTHLDVQNCKITNEGLKLLPSSLKHINLQMCEEITDEGLNSLPQSINHLDVGYTGITSCESLRNFSLLKHLDLTQCNVSDESVQHFPPSLEWLNLSRCKLITALTLKNLPPHLEFVNIKSTSLNSHELKHFSPSLKVYI